MLKRFKACPPSCRLMLEIQSINFISDEEVSVTTLTGVMFRLHPDYLLQWTGLKDRDGADIYEGDVLSLDDEMYGFIMYENGAFKLDVGSITQENTLFNRERSRKFVRVGNVYENPGLLN